MEEKIKIYVTDTQADILRKDAELFEFTKANGAVNMNAFLNRLIINYVNIYQEKQNRFQKALEKENVHADAVRILELYESSFDAAAKSRTDVTLSLKPVKESADLILYITECLLNGRTLSGYFRSLLASYTAMPRNEREKILFIDTIEALNRAIENGHTVWFSTAASGTYRRTVIPYRIVSSKEEFFNYLLCESRGKAHTFRISRIRKVFEGNRKSAVTPSVKEDLERMIKYGPQFVIRNDPEIRVRLSDKGKERFQSFYLHRPVPDQIDGDVYIFRCSEDQVLNYFSRFGQSAFIESPASLRRKAERFYHDAYDLYHKASAQNDEPIEPDDPEDE